MKVSEILQYLAAQSPRPDAEAVVLTAVGPRTLNVVATLSEAPDDTTIARQWLILDIGTGPPDMTGFPLTDASIRERDIAKALQVLQDHSEWFEAMQPIVHPYSPGGSRHVTGAVQTLRQALLAGAKPWS